MSIETQWVCDDCGARVMLNQLGVPNGWTWYSTGNRRMRHRCPVCSPAADRMSTGSRFWGWCRRNPAFAALLFNNVLLLATIMVVTSVLATRCAAQVKMLQERIETLHRGPALGPPAGHDPPPVPSELQSDAAGSGQFTG